MKKYFLNTILIITDLLSLIGLFFITLLIRVNITADWIPKFDVISIKDFSFVIVILISLLYSEKIYTFRFDFWQEMLKIIKSFFIGFILVLAVLTLTKTNLEYSRFFIVIYFSLGFIFLSITKRYVKKVIYSFSFFKNRTLIVGNEGEIEFLKEEFENNWYLGQKYVKDKYDSIVIVSKGMDTKELNDLISQYLNQNNELFIVPYITDINFANSNIMEYSNIRCNTIQIENKLLIKRNIWIKNIFDKVVVLLMLPILFFIHVVISILIMLDSKGSIFFRQHRLGKDDNDFVCYKYRTMPENSGELLKKYLKDNPDEVQYYEEFHKYKNDPRITKIGKFLRALSLDELPQVLNILKGEMSLVGPRPYMLNECDKLGDNKHFILKVSPGITGLWQVSGRSELTFLERNNLEIWYIKNWSLWADLVILIKTVKVVIYKVGAR